MRLGRTSAPALHRMLERLAVEVKALEVGDGTLAIGVDDALLPGPDASRPLLVVPACGPTGPTPWGRALVRAADAVALLDAVEARGLGDALLDRPVLDVGLPRPPARPDGAGLDPGAAPDALVDAWARHGGGTSAGAGVAWITGRGLAPLATALEAWAEGRAVVALPDVGRHDLLRRGRVVHARTPLEAIEATRFLSRTPALARALGARGRDVAAALPTPRAIAFRLLEGVELARLCADAPP